MNYLRYLLLMILLLNIPVISGQDVKFFVIEEPKGSTDLARTLSKGWSSGFVTELVLLMTMQGEYPCVGIVESGGIKKALDEVSLWETPEFGSKDISEYIENAYNSVYRSDYYLLVSIYSMDPNITDPNALTFSSLNADIKCYDKHGKVIIEYSKTYTQDEVFGIRDGTIHSNEVNKPARDFVKELDKFEICPFTGPVTIEVKSERDESISSSIPCLEGKVTIDVNIKSNSTLKWELTKEDLNMTSGTVTYDLKEKYETVTNNPCYICKDGTKGFAKITETADKEAKVQGLSNESIADGAKVSDARIELSFLDNGTFMLLVKATSQKGPMKVTTEKKVEAQCQSGNESEPPDTKNKSIDVPYTVVFGPYQGIPKDKILHKKETKDISLGQEKSSVTIDFTLTHD